MGERILAVRAELVTSMNIPEGISLYSPSTMNEYIKHLGEGLIIEDRDLLEGNPTYRQIIPYVLLSYQGVYFSAVRTKAGGDSRLHGKRILGFGGHANWMETLSNSLASQLQINALRELEEELVIKDSIDIVFSGFINNLSTPVDKDHIGIYIRAELNSPMVYINETSVLVDSGFLTKESIQVDYDSLENWSKLVFSIL